MSESPRIAIFFDLENLLHRFREDGRWGEGVHLLAGLLAAYRARGTVVAAVGVCDRNMSRNLLPYLPSLRLRVFPHRGGDQAADLDLVERLGREVPKSCETVVIVSGDSAFADAAAGLRRRGLRVEVISMRDHLSHLLYKESSVAVVIPQFTTPAA